jgi:hypothetical protein
MKVFDRQRTAKKDVINHFRAVEKGSQKMYIKLKTANFCSLIDMRLACINDIVVHA